MDFDKIYNEYYNQIKRTAKSYLRNEEDALDVTQDTFLRAYEMADKYDDSYSLSTWLTQICINKCKDKLRQRKAEKKRFVPATEGNEHLLDSREDTDTPDSIISAEEDKHTIFSTFLNLPDNLCAALTMRYTDDASYKEMAEKLEIPVNTAKTWVRRGRTQLLNTIRP